MTGAALLNEIHEFITKFVVFPTMGAADAVTLWAAHAHALEAFDSTPRLALLSPEPGSGKSRTEEVLELLVPNPMHALSASTAAVFRSIEGEKPTLLFDEVDAIFGRHGKDDGAEDLRGLLNAGHRRGASIPRCVGKAQEVVKFPVFAAVALAGLGDLPDTLMSRSVIIRMRRRAPHERVASFRFRNVEPAGHALCDRLADWAKHSITELTDARPAMPPGIEDRPADCWEPLIAVADAVGGDWPVRARAACVELVKVGASREASLGVRLLSDLKVVFGSTEVMATEDILSALHGMDEVPGVISAGAPSIPAAWPAGSRSTASARSTSGSGTARPRATGGATSGTPGSDTSPQKRHVRHRRNSPGQRGKSVCG